MRKKDDEKKRHIKEAVVRLILEEGFHGTSISKIAKMAMVSPATVYIYYENKEIMLQDIYHEYSEEIFDYILDRVGWEMAGEQLIEIIIRSYYDYIWENKEIFSFVEQFSNCPSLVGRCAGIKGICNVNELLSELKQKRVLKNYSNDNLLAIMFYPIKAIALDSRKSEAERAALLEEMIKIIQDALLIQ
ncbi:TetR/AcrR family transcriptional regulator [Clostridium aminobutyricum]|uniref:TetR/AcrR family transcriptional regulator n=1 Tax=Clostridium aminobutyricum TaxID=33953 RepID=A0A939D9F4_CLOAM|nr:TetR/AcrR family transcriptional regulator [Clostridium aminobutyricum]MBN7773601.1 TetR/AcrR family transcriptional regulator [Clostridium aminobutyricum]